MKLSAIAFFATLSLLGCQPKSDVEQCVDAVIEGNCEDKNDADCVKNTRAQGYLACLKAASGKKD